MWRFADLSSWQTSLYVSRFLSAWGDRLWGFATSIFMMVLQPEDLRVCISHVFVIFLIFVFTACRYKWTLHLSISLDFWCLHWISGWPMATTNDCFCVSFCSELCCVSCLPLCVTLFASKLQLLSAFPTLLSLLPSLTWTHLNSSTWYSLWLFYLLWLLTWLL